MKLKYVLVGALIGFSAYAFTRTATTAGAVPSAATDGVSLQGIKGCRASIYVADSGTINSGTLRAYYYDSTMGWTRSSTDLDCVLESASSKGLSTVASHVCEYQVVNQIGRIGFASNSIAGVDGGTPNGVGVDGGQNVEPVVRVECYGENWGQ